MNAWVLDKGTPLGVILLHQGDLREDTHSLLEALVQKHIEMHGNDPAQSLAAIGPTGSARKQLEQVADPDLQASLCQVAVTPPEDPDPWATRSVSGGSPPSSGLRFRILRPHAEGGLGKVSVALDEELKREVALKEIRDRYADDEQSRLRFLREAEITGRLEHPGIVPVYGLGRYPDGRPFYAMRFIRGETLQEAISRFHSAEVQGRDLGERVLELRNLLGRFIDVCNALAYAHSRGVLHRDLKPGNIMLGKYGETLVVDWGLAKLLEQSEPGPPTEEHPLRLALPGESLETLPGSQIGTLQYMSPEQAAGRLDLLGPASDIYSLGATLYCLLTGQAPFRGADPAAILGCVQRGEFARPREIKRNIPGPLEAICLKAMALRPEDRYASAQALVDDLEHWAADESISAPVPAAEIVRRRHHRDRALGQIFSPTILRQLTDSNPDLDLPPAEADLTILFCDLHELSHGVASEAERLLSLLNQVGQALGVMTQNILDQEGTLGDFHGFTAMGFWGWPLPQPDAVERACRAALGIRSYFGAVGREPGHPLAGFQAGIGIASGRAVAGIIGSGNQVKVTVVGPAVSLASVLESMTRQWGVSIVIDEATAARLSGGSNSSWCRCRRLAPVQPRGMTTRVTVSELLPSAAESGALPEHSRRDYEAALDAFVAGRWDAATSLLQRVPPQDGGRRFLNAFMERHQNSPPVSWNGVVVLEEK
jgi:serine/threonine protein kinase